MTLNNYVIKRLWSIKALTSTWYLPDSKREPFHHKRVWIPPQRNLCSGPGIAGCNLLCSSYFLMERILWKDALHLNITMHILFTVLETRFHCFNEMDLFVFPFQTTWCYSREQPLSNVVLCTCICMHNLWKNKKENITWSEMGKQNVQVKEVHWSRHRLWSHWGVH